ncbi:MAG: hypothetical protein WBD11_00260 [Xanthobacteraceae bacterium]|jgi:hypothetical protein
MSNDTIDNDGSIARKCGGAMRIFIFKSEVNPNLRAFGDDLAGIKLPGQFKPWRAVGSVAPNQDLPYKIARDEIEKAISESGFQLFRLKKRAKAAS